MDTYPSTPQTTNSAEVRVSGREMDRATNGTPRVRSFFTAQKKEFTVVHEYISIAEKQAIEAFLAAHETSLFYFKWLGDGQTYTCLLGPTDPQYMPHSGLYWSVTVHLVQA